MRVYPDLPVARLLELFDVNLEVGTLVWRKPPSRHPRLKGTKAGSFRANGSGKMYCRVRVDGIPYLRSHLIFLAAYGRMPVGCIDHIDGNSKNDAISNLREATATENAWNHKGRAKSSPLPMGVRQLPSGRFQARIAHLKKQIAIGVFETVDDAVSAYKAKRRELFGAYH